MYQQTQSNTTPAIVTRYLETFQLSMRSFALLVGITHAAVSNWASGKAEPETGFLMRLWGEHNDWRHEFANEILRLRFPDSWTSNGNGHEPEPCKEEE